MPSKAHIMTIHTPAAAGTPTCLGERERFAAWKFYCCVLGGTQLPPDGSADANARVRFLVGNVIIETGPEFRNARARINLCAEAAEDVAIRCWDAGFSVHVRERRRRRSSLAVVDPFGRYIDLVPNDHGPVPERPDG